VTGNGAFRAKPIQRQTLADRLAEDIADLILSGALAPGDALPAGPELARQYGVSRAVVRDATNLLAARGLVDVRHGSGVYVTASQTEAFGDALLLALQRAEATAWDLEEFEEMLLPAVVALVATVASDEEIAHIRGRAEDYFDAFAKGTASTGDAADGVGGVDSKERPFAHMLRSIYDAAGNKVVRQIGEQLLALRRPRSWVGITESEALEMDRAVIDELLSILESRDPVRARERAEQLMKLPHEAVAAMKATPIGEVPRIEL